MRRTTRATLLAAALIGAPLAGAAEMVTLSIPYSARYVTSGAILQTAPGASRVGFTLPRLAIGTPFTGGVFLSTLAVFDEAGTRIPFEASEPSTSYSITSSRPAFIGFSASGASFQLVPADSAYFFPFTTTVPFYERVGADGIRFLDGQYSAFRASGGGGIDDFLAQGLVVAPLVTPTDPPTLPPSPVAEPGPWSLVLGSLGLLAWRRSRRRPGREPMSRAARVARMADVPA